jgi:hypothetical protein
MEIKDTSTHPEKSRDHAAAQHKRKRVVEQLVVQNAGVWIPT